MTYLLQTLISLGQLVLGFYGFWLVWQVLLPELPGPRDPKDRIAPLPDTSPSPSCSPLAGVCMSIRGLFRLCSSSSWLLARRL